MKVTVVLVFCAFVFGAFAADKTVGQTTYNAKCKACHGAEGQGNPGLAKSLKVELKPLASDDVQKTSDAELKTVIAKGKGKMKPVSISGADLDNVVAFVRSLKK
jgi:mono/diheme cytochrome c family protein